MTTTTLNDYKSRPSFLSKATKETAKESVVWLLLVAFVWFWLCIDALTNI